MPSFQVSRNAFTCSGSREMSACLPSFTSRVRRDLPVGVELDAVGRVEIDALHLAVQALALGEARHHLKAVAQDHAVRPVLVVLVELGALLRRQAVEVGEQVGRVGSPSRFAAVRRFRSSMIALGWIFSWM